MITDMTKKTPTVPTKIQTETMEESKIPAPVQANSTQEAIIAFLDLEMRRLRWEIQQLVIIIGEIKPEGICNDTRCQWLDRGRILPHVRNSECQPRKERM